MKRIRDFFRATYHEIRDEINQPESMISTYLHDIEKEIVKAKEVIYKQQIIGTNFGHQMIEAKKLAVKRGEQAKIAFEAGEEELSRKAFAEMKHYEAKAVEYQTYAQNAEAQVKELREQVSKLALKYQDLKDKKNNLIARAAAAEAKKRINEALVVTSGTVIQEMMRMEEWITEKEIKAKAYSSVELDHLNASPVKDKNRIKLNDTEKEETKIEDLVEAKSEGSGIK